jgi:hypothetical protein
MSINDRNIRRIINEKKNGHVKTHVKLSKNKKKKIFHKKKLK